MNYILWILAFLGVAVIYFGKRVFELAGKNVSEKGEIALRSVGMVISAVAMVILYMTGKLI